MTFTKLVAVLCPWCRFLVVVQDHVQVLDQCKVLVLDQILGRDQVLGHGLGDQNLVFGLVLDLVMVLDFVDPWFSELFLLEAAAIQSLPLQPLVPVCSRMRGSASQTLPCWQQKLMFDTPLKSPGGARQIGKDPKVLSYIKDVSERTMCEAFITKA